LRLNQLEPFLVRMKAMDDMIKSFKPIDTACRALSHQV
jgi:2-dehydro-3-deoxyphosphooctonate aldolase (KDO 8-P synthase)